MQQMVNAVRSTGAANVLMLGGERWSNDLTGWLQYKPTDPDNNLAVSWHSYNFNACANPSCWNSQIAPVIAQVPLIAGEIGETDCTGSCINPLTKWLDSQQSTFMVRACHGAVHAVGESKCLDADGACATSGTQVQIWDSNGQANQSWTHTSANQLAACSGSSTLCPHAAGDQATPGTRSPVRTFAEQVRATRAATAAQRSRSN